MKKVGLIKRMFCFLLIFLISINSFAAVVSDNDGSAFITKAEFDSLKNSFQSQMDQYNTSIDSKIDGAISSYLAGIRKSLSTETSTLLDYSGGVLSLVEDGFNASTSAYQPKMLPWTMGNMGFDWSGQLSWVSSNAEKLGTTKTHEFCSYIVDVKRTPTDYKERMINNYDVTNKEACWLGYCNTQQKVSGASNEVMVHNGTVKHTKLVWNGATWAAQSDLGSGTEDDPYKVETGFLLYNVDGNAQAGLFSPITADRTPLNQKDEVFYHESFYQPTSTGNWKDKTAYFNNSIATGEGSQNLNFKAKGNNFERTIVSKANELVIVCNNDTKYEAYRFSDNDLVSGWNTEDDDRFRTGISTPGKSHNSMLPAGTVHISQIGIPGYYREQNSSPIYLDNGQVFKGYLDATTDETYWFKIRTEHRTSSTPAFGTTIWQKDQPPYFGFMPSTELDDWRQLYTDKYDAIIDMTDLKNHQKEGDSTVYTNTAGTQLMLGAGLPVLKLDKGCKYTLTVTVNSSSLTGETGDYYLWLKDGTFTKNKKPQNESNLFTIDGLTKDSTGYILPAGTTKTITIETNAAGYLFCKWRNKNLTGGGNLKIERIVTKVSEG